ncbi:MAG: hypothetical protein FJZ80_00485 [Bacteroidetes bacterium]|nr:hypothetical protein [Bacteroidota bacterium]
MKSGLLILLFLTGYWVIGQSPWMGNTSPDYPTLIRHLQKLDKTSDRMSMYIMGPSDVPGLPIYLCVLNAGKDSLETFTKAQRGTTLLFNNAIHPGEPDGINASLLYAENYLKLDSVNPTDPLVAFIPAYNVGGMLNRSSTSRANQNGPVEYGFRGNAQNLDLNRDFIKMDSENARTFVQIFHALKPDVFIDNHVSNGADYQYTLTYISSVRERIAPALRKLIYGTLLPQLTQDLKSSKWDLFPYVETVKETPDSGIYQFNDLPRYAMGYASLFNCVAFTVETHMLKPFPNRVRATYDFMVSLIRWSVKNARQIEQARENANEWESFRPYFRYNYTRTSEADSIVFKGFKAVVDTHQITGLGHLKYDRTQPYQKSIPFYKCYVPKDSLPIPQFYIIRGQELRIIEHLRNNGFLMDVLKEEKKLRVYAQIVRSFDAISKPYEGHYMHTNKEIERVEKWITFRPGDVVIPSNQNGSLFLHSVLQPEAEDSYFTWNYFDSYLQEKEYFSNYVFVDKIRSILQSNPELRQEYEAKKRSDSEFASSEWQQLYFLYQHSPFFEPSYMMLPVFELK